MENIKPWGKSVAIDLYNCNPEKLTNQELLKTFIGEVVKVVDMEAHGPCYVDKFGEGDLHGISAMQFIKTSNITVHLDDVGGRAFIDIFSCKDFDAEKAVDFARHFFEAKHSKITTLDR